MTATKILDLQTISIAGVELTGITAGIKISGKPDLAFLAFPAGATWSVVTTPHVLRAAPVRHMENLRQMTPRPKLKLLLINSGNANACTGPLGAQAVDQIITKAATEYGVNINEVMMASTGVIGVALPAEKIITALTRGFKALKSSGWQDAATAIMTTDAYLKFAYRTVYDRNGNVVGHLAGIAKGAGMIAPNMATMLAFVVTDLTIDSTTLDTLLAAATAVSFNAIMVDGDMSTNDVLLLAATGASRQTITAQSELYLATLQALIDVCQELALSIVKDGEGAKRIAQIAVVGATDGLAAKSVAAAIARSALFRTALHGGDPNWGRIAAAAGSAGVALTENDLEIRIGDVVLFNRGNLPTTQAMTEAAAAMQHDQVNIEVRIGQGQGSATVWVSDLGHDYVEINSAYRT